jgi:outer membrane receptor protein involved in Fe transport
MSPFEVKAEKDNSYGALNSNSITQFNVELLKTPVAADIFTEQFMKDMGVTSVEELLNNYGAGSSTIVATAEDALSNQPGDRYSVSQNGSRGLSAGVTRRNGFLASTTGTSFTNSFDVERVDMVKGANAMLYGASGAGGVVNTTSKQGRFNKKLTSLSLRIDQYGSRREEFDVQWGNNKVAMRGVFLNDNQSFPRQFLCNDTRAYYAAFMIRDLPFNSTLKVTARKTDNYRIISTRQDDLVFTNGDPRNKDSMVYMLISGRAGATDPVTGLAYPSGPILNGKLNFDNAYSYGGWSQSEDLNSKTFSMTVETVWTKWLSTSFAALLDLSGGLRGPQGTTILAPKSMNSANPLEEWVAQSNFRMDWSEGRRHAYRGSAVLTNDLFGKRAKSTTLLGYDLDFYDNGMVSYQYFLSDSEHRILLQPGIAGADALGRINIGNVNWSVGNGPVMRPYFKIGTRQVTANGKDYVLTKVNPRDESFVSPYNPLGLVSMVPGFTSISGTNTAGFNNETKAYGLYGANYTSWLNERLYTLFGYRASGSSSRTPNTNIANAFDYSTTSKNNSSYNAGVSGRIRDDLYAYYNVGQTFEPARGSNDFFGNPPKDTQGFSHEIGLKYEPRAGIVSGSLSYYEAKSKNENFNYLGTNKDLVNPPGLNGAFQGVAGANQWLSLDKQSRGLELILTAAPTRNWRARLGFTQQEGTILSDAQFPILWNDAFYYSKSTGGVTYADGSPFMVPTDSAGISSVKSANALRAPVVGKTNAQLTIAMMSDPTNDYYAYGKGAAVNANGRITANSVVYRALKWFNNPVSGTVNQAITNVPGKSISDIPYAYSDPNLYAGTVVFANKGEPVIGAPKYRVVFTNNYQFSEGWFKGLGLGVTARWDGSIGTIWYNEPGSTVRKLYSQPNITPQINALVSYRRKLGRVEWQTQLNVNNVFNKYTWDAWPDRASGFTVEANITGAQYAQPRQFVWTNTLLF